MSKTIKRYAVIAVDYGDSTDGKGRILDMFKTKEEAHDFMEADAKQVAEEQGNEYRIHEDAANVGDTSEIGCEYSIQEIEIELSDEELRGGEVSPSISKSSEQMAYSPFTKIKVTAQVDWDVDEDDGEAPDRDVQIEVYADPDMFNAGVIDDSDPLNWVLDEDALKELIGDKLSDEFGFCHKGFTYTFTPVP